MLELKGKYSKDCKVYAETLEESALKQIYNMLESPAFDGIKVRMMPDCHTGSNCCIGTSYHIGNYVDPCHIGLDIGCCMTSIILSQPISKEKYAEFEHKIRKDIPTGFNVHKYPVIIEKDFYKYLNNVYDTIRSGWPDMIADIGHIDERYITEMCKRINMDLGLFYKSLGTLGGGNHFMELGESENGKCYFTIHCGSRNFGVKVCNYWAKIAKNGKISKDVIKGITELIKTTEPDKKKWKKLIEKTKIAYKELHPSGYLYGENLKGYLSDMVIAQAYASYNHDTIIELVRKILNIYGITISDKIRSVHNYIDFKDHILRKGAIRAYEGEKMIIPFNMRDGLAICEGKSNDDWNFTAPHGAGRIMSRTEARKCVNIDDFKKSMDGIYSTCVGYSTVDESPMAYKDTDEIIRLIEPTAKILTFVKPKINIKATDIVCDSL